MLRLRRAVCVGRNVLFEKRVVEFADKFSRIERNLLFAPDVFAFAVYEELKPVKILFQVGKEDAFRFVVGLFRVVHKEFGKIAGYNPLRMLTQGEFRDILFCLLNGRKGIAVRLLRRLAQIFVGTFLFYHYARFGDVRIDKIRNGLVFNLFFDLRFKKDKIRAVFNAQNARQ